MFINECRTCGHCVLHGCMDPAVKCEWPLVAAALAAPILGLPALARMWLAPIHDARRQFWHCCYYRRWCWWC